MTERTRQDLHPVFVGRDAEVENLMEAITSALSGQGSAIILSGEAGIGKSRLIEEIQDKAYMAGFVTLEGQCHSESGYPFGGFLDIFRSICSLERSKMGRIQASLGPEDREKARALHLLDDFVCGRLDEWRTDPQIKGDRIRYATLDVIRSIARNRPAMIVVEDLQWADSSTAELFNILARNCRDERVVLIGSYRTEEMEDGGIVPAKTVLDRMLREGLVREIELNRLTMEDVDAVMPSLLGNDIDRQVFRLIESSSEGNPLLIVELTRNLADSGVIVEVDEYWMIDPTQKVQSSPTSLDELLQHQLGKINWIEGRVMEVASLIGMDIDTELLANVIGTDTTEIRNILNDVASKTGLLVLTFHGFRFRHNKIREILSERIPDLLGRELHLALAESLERLHLDVDRKEELAWHYKFTDNYDKCIEYSLASADRMLNSYALDEALALYLAALAKATGLTEHVSQIRRALEGAGICFEEKGEYDKAAEMFTGYLETCPPANERTRVLLRLIECWEPPRLGLGNLDSEKLLINYLLETGPVEGVNLARFHDMLANIDNWEKRFEDAMEHRAQAEKIYLETGQMEKYALDLSFHAYTLLSSERLEEAEKNIRAALAIFREHPYNYGIMDAEMCTGEILMSLGEDDQSLIHFEKSASIAAEIGEHVMECWILCNMSIQQLELKKEEAARSSLRRAEQVARFSPSRFAVCGPISFQAYLEADTRHAERAIVLADAAVKILEEYKFPSVAGALAMMGYAKALNSQGENEMAMDRFEDALRQIRGCPNSAILEARAYWWMGNSMIEQGNNADARIMLEKARPIFERIDNHRMMGIIDQTLRKISLAESMRSDDTPS